MEDNTGKIMKGFLSRNIGKILFISFPALWLISGVIVYQLGEKFNKEQLQNSASLGDMFGVINALFSGLALAGIVYTIFQQEKNFKIQEKVLETQVEGLKQSAAEQERNLKIQKDLLNSQIDNMKQTSSLSAKAILLEAYSKRIDWYYTKSEDKTSTPEDSVISMRRNKEFTEQHETLMNEIEAILTNQLSKPKKDS